MAKRLGASSIHISTHNVLNSTHAIFRCFEGILFVAEIYRFSLKEAK